MKPKKKENAPIVVISSWVPRMCGIATFTEEAVEFIRKRFPEREVFIISHPDGEGDNVFPIMDTMKENWEEDVAKKVHELDPYVVHIEHEYGLYTSGGKDEHNIAFLRLLSLLKDVPTVIEPHTIHGRLRLWEKKFVMQLTAKCSVLLLKCHYQKWRMEWSLKDIEVPKNMMVVPHGARPDRRDDLKRIDDLKREMGFEELIGKKVVGLIGWIQDNKRWDIVLNIWKDLHRQIAEETGENWVLFAAGNIRDMNHIPDFSKYVLQVKDLESKGIARFYQFTPRGKIYYKVMSICDFIVLPSIDETQSGTLARIISLLKPYITTAPLEGLTEQTVASEGGLLFNSKELLKKQIMRLATSEKLRKKLSRNLKSYLEDVVSWEIVVDQYAEAYKMANEYIHEGKPVEIESEF